MNRLEQKYVETVKPSLMKEFNYSSSMEAPKIVNRRPAFLAASVFSDTSR